MPGVLRDRMVEYDEFVTLSSELESKRHFGNPSWKRWQDLLPTPAGCTHDEITTLYGLSAAV